jgi:hypothetical protein
LFDGSLAITPSEWLIWITVTFGAVNGDIESKPEIQTETQPAAVTRAAIFELLHTPLRASYLY